MPFFTVPDGTHLYHEEVGEGEPLLLVSGQGLDHSFGMVFATISQTGIVSSSMITEEQVRATSQALRPMATLLTHARRPVVW